MSKLAKLGLIAALIAGPAFAQTEPAAAPEATAPAAAKSGSTGVALEGAVAVSPGVWLFQNTSSGLVAEIGIKGTKYYKDTTLN